MLLLNHGHGCQCQKVFLLRNLTDDIKNVKFPVVKIGSGLERIYLSYSEKCCELDWQIPLDYIWVHFKILGLINLTVE